MIKDQSKCGYMQQCKPELSHKVMQAESGRQVP